MKKKILSYAQDEEDLILFSLLNEIKEGFYIDVGANDPINISVTKLFYDLGWHGINIEPLHDKYLELCEYRPRDINLNLGAGDEETELDLYVSGGSGEGSTFDKNIGGGGKFRKNMTVKVRKLTDIILENFDVEKTDIHFCKIDVENFERQVLGGIDFQLIRPWIFVVESTFPGTSIPNYQSWENILIDAGYLLIYDHGINRYYIDKNKKELFDVSKYDHINEEYDIYYVNKNKISNNIFYKISTLPLLYLINFITRIKMRRF